MASVCSKMSACQPRYSSQRKVPVLDQREGRAVLTDDVRREEGAERDPTDQKQAQRDGGRGCHGGRVLYREERAPRRPVIAANSLRTREPLRSERASADDGAGHGAGHTSRFARGLDAAFLGGRAGGGRQATSWERRRRSLRTTSTAMAGGATPHGGFVAILAFQCASAARLLPSGPAPLRAWSAWLRGISGPGRQAAVALLEATRAKIARPRGLRGQVVFRLRGARIPRDLGLRRGPSRAGPPSWPAVGVKLRSSSADPAPGGPDRFAWTPRLATVATALLAWSCTSPSTSRPRWSTSPAETSPPATRPGYRRFPRVRRRTVSPWTGGGSRRRAGMARDTSGGACSARRGYQSGALGATRSSPTTVARVAGLGVRGSPRAPRDIALVMFLGRAS